MEETQREVVESRTEEARIEAARRLWVENGGRNYTCIERKMRAAGWKFSKNVLYTREEKGKTRVGWPDKFGWYRDLTVQQHEKLQKIVKRRRRGPAADTDFAEWLERRHAAGGMRWDWPYQRYVLERLAAVTRGECKRLMIFMPPRHGKSEMVTIRYVAWRLLRDARTNVIIGSYNQRLANRFSRRIRRLVDEGSTAECGLRTAESDGGRSEREDEGPVNANLTSRISESPQSALLSPHSARARALAEWETAGGGVVRAVGVGGGIAGFGAGLVVIDDPVRSRADAESERKRDAIDDWFKNDIYTRLEPEAAIILIQTRWHEDDLAGRLLKEMEDGGEKWEVVRLPALSEPPVVTGGIPQGEASDESTRARAHAYPPLTSGGSDSDPLGREPGEALCPERYGAEKLAAVRRKLGSYAFEALYQQNPSPAEGGQFKRAWFKKVIDHMPAGLRWKRGYDLAVSTSTTADYTASFRVAMDKMGNLYIADGFRGKIEYPEQRRYIVERMRNEPDTEHGIEAAMHGKAVVQDLRREPGIRRYALREVRVAGDKLTRALAWLNLAEEGKVFLVRGGWIEEFVDEVAAFPTGRHDDQIDAVSTAVNMLTNSGKRAWGF